MPIGVEEIIRKIDIVLSECRKYDPSGFFSRAEHRHVEIFALLDSTIDQFAPNKSGYSNAKAHILESGVPFSFPDDLYFMNRKLIEVLKALRLAYRNDLLTSMQELIRADLFDDFLEMSEYLLNEGYKDAAAVMFGGVLEGHLRKLCLKYSIDVVKSDGKPVKASQMNSDLYNKKVYNGGDNKSITAWLDLRNSAAHGKYSEYTPEQVKTVLMGVRDFINRYPA